MSPQKGGFHKCTGGWVLPPAAASLNPCNGLLASLATVVIMGLSKHVMSRLYYAILRNEDVINTNFLSSANMQG